MLPPRETDPERPASQDAARLADVLEHLNAHLTDAAESVSLADRPDIQELVAAAVAELSRLGPYPMSGGASPVLGPGVVQELLRLNREHAFGEPVPPKFDTRR